MLKHDKLIQYITTTRGLQTINLQRGIFSSIATLKAMKHCFGIYDDLDELLDELKQYNGQSKRVPKIEKLIYYLDQVLLSSPELPQFSDWIRNFDENFDIEPVFQCVYELGYPYTVTNLKKIILRMLQIDKNGFIRLSTARSSYCLVLNDYTMYCSNLFREIFFSSLDDAIEFVFKGKPRKTFNVTLFSNKKNEYVSSRQELIELYELDKNKLDDDGFGAVYSALKTRNIENLEALYRLGANFDNKYGIVGQTLLDIAIAQNDFESASFLLSLPNVSANTIGDHGYTTLGMAVSQSNYDLVELLLKNGAIVDLQDLSPQQNTPKLHAVARGDLKMLKLLVKFGEIINKYDLLQLKIIGVDERNIDTFIQDYLLLEMKHLGISDITQALILKDDTEPQEYVRYLIFWNRIKYVENAINYFRVQDQNGIKTGMSALEACSNKVNTLMNIGYLSPVHAITSFWILKSFKLSPFNLKYKGARHLSNCLAHHKGVMSWDTFANYKYEDFIFLIFTYNLLQDLLLMKRQELIDKRSSEKINEISKQFIQEIEAIIENKFKEKFDQKGINLFNTIAMQLYSDADLTLIKLLNKDVKQKHLNAKVFFHKQPLLTGLDETSMVLTSRLMLAALTKRT